MAPTKSAAARLQQLSGMETVFRTGDPRLRTYRSLRQAALKKPVKELKRAIAGDRKILLILTNALELNCVPFADLTAHFHSMSVIATITRGLRDRVATALRTKPGLFGEDPLIYRQLSGFSPDIDLTSERATFSECLGLADCVVGVNVPTSGYYEILRNGPPLIHFQGAKVVCRQPDLGSDAIINITDPEMLGPAIEALLFDTDHRNSALQRQAAFASSDFELSDGGSKDPVLSTVQRLIKATPYRKLCSRWFGRNARTELLPRAEPDYSSMSMSSSGGAGSVDEILFTLSGRGRVIGWAADLDAKQSARTIHLFLNDRWVGGGAPSTERPDVAAAYARPEFLQTGFSIELQAEDARNLDALKVYAQMRDGSFYQLSRSF